MGPDTTPPTVIGCPSDITQEIATGQTSIPVTWTEPTATDNVTPANQISRLATHQPNQAFLVGTTNVQYIFTDQAGNIATCAFNVIVSCEFLWFAVIFYCQFFICQFFI